MIGYPDIHPKGRYPDINLTINVKEGVGFGGYYAATAIVMV